VSDRSLEKMVESAWYGRGAEATVLRTLLRPCSALFGIAVAVRARLYASGVLATHRVATPVVSVGSLRVGGAGKTPFVLWLAGRLVEAGLRPAIVTRGYGGELEAGATLLVTAASAKDPDTLRLAGDEAVLLALRSGLAVAVGRDRRAACELAEASARPDVLLLDDGFQHRALARDLDIVLVAGGESSESLLPAGPLREKTSALARAGIVVVTGEGAWSASPGRSRPAISGRPAHRVVSRSRTWPSLVVSSVADTTGTSPALLAARRVVAVAAIARPQRFLADLERCGAHVTESLLFGDHHVFGPADWRSILAAAEGAELVVTTEKDLVKLARFGAEPRLRALRIEVAVEDEDALLGAVATVVRFDRSGLRTHHPPSSGGPNPS
jgi:tetraacyldisaccharide 4'-kinase